MGNLTDRMAAHNFAPLMTMAAARTVVRVSHLVEPGGINPEAVVTSGIFVDPVVLVPRPAQEEALNRAGAHYRRWRHDR